MSKEEYDVVGNCQKKYLKMIKIVNSSPFLLTYVAKMLKMAFCQICG